MAENKFIQLFVKLIDNKTLTLQVPAHQTLTPELIKHQIQTLTQIPTQSLTLTLNGKLLNNKSPPISPKSLSLSTLHLNFSLLGGKGGFGSLLRGAATKAGQKKTNNFDACRDMSGRRLRHVNAEKKLEEWKAEQEERRLEKVAEEYLKKMEKKGKGGKKDQGAEKYVEKYREQSAKCVEEVERAVKESVMEMLSGGKKRKLMEKLKGKEKDEGAAAKKLKIWMGKRKLGEDDSDISDEEENDDSDAEKEKSVVIDNGNQSDSSKDASSGSVPVPRLTRDHCTGGSSDSGSEEEKETTSVSTGLGSSPSGSDGHVKGNSPMDVSLHGEKLSATAEEVIAASSEIVIEQDPSKLDPRGTSGDDHQPSTASLEERDGPELATAVPKVHEVTEGKSASLDEGVSGSPNEPEVVQALNFDDYNSPADLEVLGMERLKSELQARGLKCGGTLQERAARLFLLKTTPMEKLPKKLLAKK